MEENGSLEVSVCFWGVGWDVDEVDFMEGEMGWKMFGMELSREEGYVYVGN